MVEVIITIVVPEEPCVCTDRSMCQHKPEPAHTKVWRMEFETEEDVLTYLDTSDDPNGLLNVEELKG